MASRSEKLKKAYGYYWVIIREMLYKDEFFDESKINWFKATGSNKKQ